LILGRAGRPGDRVLPAQRLQRWLGFGQGRLCARNSTGALSSAPAGRGLVCCIRRVCKG